LCGHPDEGLGHSRRFPRAGGRADQGDRLAGNEILQQLIEPGTLDQLLRRRRRDELALDDEPRRYISRSRKNLHLLRRTD
jgi:hypothetical protein